MTIAIELKIKGQAVSPDVEPDMPLLSADRGLAGLASRACRR
jgi:hypothetical protein